MADEATQEVEQTSTAETTAAESQSVEQTTQDAGTQESAEQASDTEGKADPASTGDKKQVENQDSKQDSKPLSRRSAAYRIQQLVEENKALRQQVKPKQEQNEWEEDPATGEQPNIAELIAKEVEKRLNPIVSESSKAADDAELGELFSGERAGERTKYEPKIREMWKLPQYKDVAASELYKIASFDDAVSSAVAKGIEEYKKAEKEAKDSSASGSNNTSNRTGKGGKSIADMTDEELLAHNDRVKAGQA